jgi:type II secretory pathway pseudopilin PulG
MGFVPQQQKQSHQSLGFTVIELMVTITIVVLVTGIVLVQYSSFNSSVLLTSQAYLTAFDLRETQSLAVSVRGQGQSFREEYGLYFNLGQNNQYILFQDNGTTKPAVYDPGEEIAAPNIVDPRFIIADICVTAGGAQTCGIQDLSITFKRPDFDAVFGRSTGVTNITQAEILFTPQNGSGSRTVLITQAGQISVQ